jgi:hypothetical protein
MEGPSLAQERKATDDGTAAGCLHIEHSTPIGRLHLSDQMDVVDAHEWCERLEEPRRIVVAGYDDDGPAPAAGEGHQAGQRHVEGLDGRHSSMRE